MGKLLKEMILQRLQGNMVGENGLSKNQFGFWKGRSTVDIMDDYLSDRWVLYEGNKWSLKEDNGRPSRVTGWSTRLERHV